jgi:hypothetical protein
MLRFRQIAAQLEAKYVIVVPALTTSLLFLFVAAKRDGKRRHRKRDASAACEMTLADPVHP